MRVAICGARGRLGRLIVAEAGSSFVGAVERDGDVPACDVVIDVSTPAGTAGLVPRLPPGMPLVVGTTGDLPLAALEAHARRAPVALVANFSAGVPVLLDLVRDAVARLEGWDVSVVEAHHTHKKDAPSGTARRLVEAIGRDVDVHSVRAGDTVGVHTVWIAGPGERLELSHVATRREVFALGALRTAAWLREQAPGLYKR